MLPNIRVMVFQDQGFYAAQCLEFNIAAQGRTFEDVKDNFTYCLMGQIALDADMGIEPLSRVGKASEKFWKLYDKASRLETRLTFDEPKYDRVTTRPEFAELAVL